MYFKKTSFFQKNDPPEAAPPTDGELISYTNCHFPKPVIPKQKKNDPPEAAPPTDGELI